MKTILFYFVVMVIPVLTSTWSHNSDEDQRAWKHFHTKRHLPLTRDSEVKKRSQPPRYKKKPAGSLISPLLEDDIDNDETVSVAIGPPLITPRYDKIRKRFPQLESSASNAVQFIAADTQYSQTYPKIPTNIVVDILTLLGKEFLSRQVSEDFIFGQYVGNSMRNLTKDNKLQLQHHILELVVQYQKMSEFTTSKPLPAQELTEDIDKKVIKIKPPKKIEEEMKTKNQDKVNNVTEEWSVLANLENNENQ